MWPFKSVGQSLGLQRPPGRAWFDALIKAFT